MWQRDELKRINLLEGSVRSGKTWISLVLWAFWVGTMPKDGSYLMVAKTLTSLRRNVLDLLQSLVGTRNFSYSLPRKEGRLFGRLVYLEGVNDARAESKIRGMTLQGAYCDELTLFTQDFFAMLLSRLSEPGAKVIATTNPDSPNHWLMTEYISRKDEAAGVDLLDIKYTLDDNTFLDPEYVKQIKREYTGVFYERFVLGRWVLAQGRIYDMFKRAQHVVEAPPGPCTAWYVSMDYGTSNPAVMLLWGEYGGVWIATKEYYYSGRDERRQKTDEEYYAELEKLAGGLPVRMVIVDPSAASMIATIRKHGRFLVLPADNAVLDGIRITATALNSGKIKFCACCVNTILEMESYVWDEKAAEHGEDKPLKVNDHGPDATRYFAMELFGRKSVGPVMIGGR